MFSIGLLFRIKIINILPKVKIHIVKISETVYERVKILPIAAFLEITP